MALQPAIGMGPGRREGGKVGDLDFDETICEEHASQLSWEFRLSEHSVSDVWEIEDDFGGV